MISRRGFLESLSALLVTLRLRRAKPAAPWGPVDVDRHRLLKSRGVHLRVWYRGEDVTNRCRFADDTLGYAELFLHRQRRPYVDHVTHQAAMETVYGVEIREALP